jgi:IS5 family transposase
MRRRAAVEPVIGHLKAEHRMGRNYLKGRHGDRINAVLAAAGYNFGLLLRWLERLLRALMRMLAVLAPTQNARKEMLLTGSSPSTIRLGRTEC